MPLIHGEEEKVDICGQALVVPRAAVRQTHTVQLQYTQLTTCSTKAFDLLVYAVEMAQHLSCNTPKGSHKYIHSQRTRTQCLHSVRTQSCAIKMKTY